jgi:tetratricopeptide (TPR) repeat protein
LCAVEERDCGDFGGKLAWGQVSDRLRSGADGSYDAHLAILEEQALVEVQPAPDGRFRTYLIHPVVAAAVRAQASPDLLAAVDEELSVFLLSLYRHTVKIEGNQQGLMVREFGQRALPYLIRANLLGDASDILMAMWSREQSPVMAEQLLPMLRRVAAPAAGTSSELEQRAKVARVESFVRPAVAVAELKQLLLIAEERQAFGTAVAVLNDLATISRNAGRLDEALDWIDRMAELVPKTGRGPWAQLGIESQRLQIQFIRGEAKQVLRRVRELETTMATLPDPEPDDNDPASWDMSEVWNTREVILQAGMTAAGQLQRWEEMLAFSAAMDASQAARDAPQLYRMAGKFAAYHALMGLGRLEDARDLLRACRDIFAEHNDIGPLGKAIAALGDVESRLGHHDAAVKLHEDALRLNYTQADLMAIQADHANLAVTLRRAQRDQPAALAHELAAAVIAHEAGFGALRSEVSSVARELARLPDPSSLPASFAELSERVGAVDGVDLQGLLSRYWPERSGDVALSEVLAAARRVLDTPPDLDEQLHYWEPVIAAMYATKHGDDRARAWLDRALAKESAKQPELTAVLTDLSHGGPGDSGTGSLDPASAAVARRAAEVLAGDTPVRPRADLVWRVRDYLEQDPHQGTPEIGPLLDRLADDEERQPADRASLIVDLANRAAGSGRHDDAHTALRRAAELYRPLAEADLATFGPDLATTLARMAAELGELGRVAEALAARDEGLVVRRELAGIDPARYEPALAAGLTNAGSAYAESGDTAQGLTFHQESVALYRRLARAAPAEHEPELVTALLNTGSDLSALGRGLEAVAVTIEAVMIKRDLAASAPETHQPDLVPALCRLSRRLADLGQDERALAAVQEAVDIGHRLRDAGHADIDPLLAEALGELRSRCSKLRKEDLALEAAQEAADIYRRLAAGAPTAFDFDLAAALNNLSAGLSDTGRSAEAIAALRSAADIYRRLVESDPVAYAPNQAITLSNLGAVLASAGDWTAALSVTEDVIPLQRLLVQQLPQEFGPALARSLARLALVHDKLGDPSDDAMAAAAESVTMYQGLADESPQTYEWQLEHAAVVLEKLRLTRDMRFLAPHETEQRHTARQQAPPDNAFATSLDWASEHTLAGFDRERIDALFGQIRASARIARAYLGAGLRPATGEQLQDAAGDASAQARRCLDRYLTTCRIIGICRSGFKIGLRHYLLPAAEEKTAENAEDQAAAPPDPVARAVATTERAFPELMDQLSRIIASDDEAFAACVSELLDTLIPADDDGWRLLPLIVRKREPYKWTFADPRIEGEAAVLEFLGAVKSGAVDLSGDFAVGPWIAAALDRIYAKTGPA